MAAVTPLKDGVIHLARRRHSPHRRSRRRWGCPRQPKEDHKRRWSSTIAKMWTV